ncbi:hypothetical protein HV824_35190 [Myxococcus sp. AM009]|uniref:hypothetical protein n=1 Tax=unclassified Myxococcus TaxID=2648731 RepID=UPI0015953030|nr:MULTISPECIES: hypothetical protein [unclassified Myxococcus]NVJ03323.1 hypothetical protein [Myxococcus sp. AM009]NVJ19515.1 hypothetical protein [Myxococcus sp. AM010]
MSGAQSLDLRERFIAAWQERHRPWLHARRCHGAPRPRSLRGNLQRLCASRGSGAPRKVDAAGEEVPRRLVCEPPATDEALARVDALPSRLQPHRTGMKQGQGTLLRKWWLRTRSGLQQGTPPALAAISPRDAAGGLAHRGDAIAQPF